MRILPAALLLGSSVALSGCAYGLGGQYGGVSASYGDPYGYSPYGYSPYGYSPYGTQYGYGGGFGSPYGWYGNRYYPGTGYYVYDPYRRPYVWSDAERRYWMERQARRQAAEAEVRENWSGFADYARSRARAQQGERRTEQRVVRSTKQRVNRPTERRVRRSDEGSLQQVILRRKSKNDD